MGNLATKYRPRRFEDVVGQGEEVKLLRTIVEKNWRPVALLFEGPFGTGKTSLARLAARALLCKNRDGVEPCNDCASCKAMTDDNHFCYTEIDAASKGSVEDVRELKDSLSYTVIGSDLRILTFDECHNLSMSAQNALLQTLEEGQIGVMFFLATTDAQKMLPTIRSRCVELNLRILTAKEVAARLTEVCEKEGVKADDKALKIIGTYCRGHMRDALVLLDQLINLSDEKVVTEEATRIYLRLDRRVELYTLLAETDRKKAVEQVESLLCVYSIRELTELLGEILVDAYKVGIGFDDYAQVDMGWLKKIQSAQGEDILKKAERVLTADQNVTTLWYGVAVVVDTLFGKDIEKVEKKEALGTVPQTMLRKQRD